MSISQAVKIKPSHELPAARKEAAFNLPNFLTFLRILLIPVFVGLLMSPTSERIVAAAAIFGIASLTDLLDGYLARRRAQVTTIGRLLDPIADKLLVLSGLVMLVAMNRVAAWLATALIAREIAVTGVRAIAAGEGIIIAARDFGKIKVALQIIGILLLLLSGPLISEEWAMSELGTVALYIALVFSVASAGQYFHEVFKKIRRQHP